VAFAANPAFDASTLEVWAPLLNGGRIVVIPQDVLLEPVRFARALETRGVDVLWMTVGLFNQYVDFLGPVLPRLRYLIVGGDALDPRIIARVLQQGAPKHLLNGYGPTETTTFALTHEITRVEEGARSIPLGRPIGNTRVYVLDPQGRPVPVGAAGELYIGGAGVALGYLNQPALTAERFVRDPFSSQAGARMYRTGDLARWLTDGTVEFLGRTDFQVKVRGFRIELGEIEAALHAHPAVREAVVVVREDAPGNKRLVAYCAGGDAADPEALRAHLLATLPEYMVPAAFVWLQALPLTANGKVDRRALPAPEGDSFATRGYEAPVGETEQAVAEVWSEVLGVERVGRHDNFFELGGHSLLAVRVIGGLRQRGVHAEVRALFTAPTLAELAMEVGGESLEVRVPPNRIPAGCRAITPEMLPLVSLGQAEIDAVVATVPGGAANVQDIYPLAPLQDGMLFHHLMAREGDPYLLAGLSGFDDRDGLDRYLDALQAVVARHDILRTAVVWEGLPEPVQVVWREARLEVEEVELEPGEGGAARRLYARFDPRHHRIDVRRAPLLRARVAYDGEKGRWLLLLLRHHLVSDHEAQVVLMAEIEAHLAGRGDTLPTPLPFRNFVAQARLGVSQEEHRAFFTELLGGVDEPTAAFGLLDVRGDGSAITEARLPVEGPLAARLRERARALGVSPASLFHVVWARVLARASGRDDVVFGTLLLGRMHAGEGSEGVMGPFINTLPIRVHAGSVGAEASVRQTHALLARLLRHEHASLALAQRCSGVEAPAPLFTSLLNYRHSAARPAAGAGAAAAGAAPGGVRRIYNEERTNYPLTLSVDDLGERFSLKVQVMSSGVDPAGVCGMVHTALEGLVDALETAPERAVGSIGVLPESERSRILQEWNRTETAYPAGSCLHELFQGQVQRAPDAAAVVCEGERLSYAELNARANRLAHHLRALGVGPDARVALCLERSPEMVVALLAVLKAGGAYVPMDPAYPAERLAYMLADSAPVAVLTERALRDRVDAGVPVLELDAAAPAWADRPATDPAVEGLTPEHLAYVIYTSGSTGRPKGVMVAHANLANLVHWHCAAFGVGAGSRSSSVAGLGFDAAAWEVWPVLAGGGELALPGRGRTDPEAILEWWDGQTLDVSFLPTPMAEYAFARGVPQGAVRTLLTGGDRLRRVPGEPSPFELVNNYGPTETTVVATSGTVRGAEAPGIGRPIANTRVYVLDGSMEPVPVGVAGEMYVGGVQVARGYLGRPALTAERFVPDPFGRPGARLYRTGDLVRWRPDGTLDFVGRIDHQVKVRGFRIEPGEIEARLAEHPGVREAVVVVREDAPGETRLVAYVVAEASAGAEVLRAHLGQALPAYMVPAAFVRMETLPLTPNGKIDRRALPAPEGDAYAARGYEAPAGETEQALAGIWAEVLGVERVGRGDDFFALGGHSLLAVRVTSRVRQLLGVEVAVGDVFSHPTVEALAARMGGTERRAADDRAIVLRATGAQPPLFLVYEGGGSTEYAQVLQSHIDRDIPVYALPAPPADAPLRTVEGMATRLVRMIREVRPAGPYRVAGWSFGGNLAYEIASQLIGLDETVEFVGMFDSYCPTHPSVASRGVADETAELAEVLRAGQGGDEGGRAGAAGGDLEAYVAELRAAGRLAGHVTVAQFREMRDRRCIHLHALRGYAPQPLPVAVHLFPARESGEPDLARGWRALLPEASLRVTPVPGTHASMMRAPNAASLGEALSRRLDAAREGGPRPAAEDAVVKLRSGRAGVAPVFCVPGAGTSVTSFIDLSGCVDPSWPVFGLQPRGMEGTTVPHTTVQAAAEDYLRAVHAACPEGPVHLLGHSFGGWVALEMALRLRRAGRAVASLTILDSEVPDESEAPIREYDGVEAFLKLVEVLELTAERPLGISPADARARDEAGRLKLLHGKMLQHGLITARSTPEALYGPLRTFARCLRTPYAPSGVYPDPLRLVLVDDPRRDADANRAQFARTVQGWSRWAPGLVFSVGAGNHVTALKPPHVAALAALLAEEPEAGVGAVPALAGTA